MTVFSFTAPQRVLFGRGKKAQAAGSIAASARRVLIVRGRSVAWVDALAGELAALGCAVEQVTARGEPTIDQVRDAVTVAQRFCAQLVVSVGGGAVIDLGKAVAGLCTGEGDPLDYLELPGQEARELRDSLPFVAIPTTAGTGAEATRNAVIGLPDRQLKISLRDPRLVPMLAIIDPSLTDDSPKALTLASGLDAVTQLIESYLCNRATPVTDALCRAAIPNAVAALKTLMETECPTARDTLAHSAHVSGLALANSGLGIVHGLASVIGGRGGAHGAICGRLLAASLLENRRALSDTKGDLSRLGDAEAWLADGLGASPAQVHDALRDFAGRHGLPTLAQLGVAEADHETIAAAAMHASSTKANPVPLDQAAIIRILRDAGQP